MEFPDISVQDTVRIQLRMLRDELGIQSIKCVVGGSFGGMQAVEYAAQAGTITSPFSIGDKNGTYCAILWQPRHLTLFHFRSSKKRNISCILVCLLLLL
jgi:hypothetical protein